MEAQRETEKYQNTGEERIKKRYTSENKKEKICVVMEFNIKEICFVSLVVEEASATRPCVEKHRIAAAL